jgi:hypothetical protein
VEKLAAQVMVWNSITLKSNRTQGSSLYVFKETDSHSEPIVKHWSAIWPMLRSKFQSDGLLSPFSFYLLKKNIARSPWYFVLRSLKPANLLA